MNKNQLIECVPNFSEGKDNAKLRQIATEISSVKGVKLLDVDPGAATNRTVVTFVGHPEAVIEAAFLAIKKASEVIDMAQHKGEHPRMGATDVCPLIPIAGISMEETAEYAHKLAKRVGEELDIPTYMYENAATKEEWRNLANIRQGEYEALPEKMENPAWKPDYGPATFNAKAGATVIGARDFLVAYNVNLNTTSTRRANAIAFDIREKGRIKREGDPLNGKIIRDEAGQPLRVPGKCKSVKAIGWFIEEYGIAQISMNLTNINITSLHEAYEACFESALERGLRVTGSELVGLVPKQVMIDAGKYFLKKQERSCGISESEIIKIAVKSMGLDELAPFEPEKKIIEYLLDAEGANPLVNMTLTDFAHETASESPAPGGGSISAYVGTLGIALGNMVANLSAHKKGWDDRWEYFSDMAEKSQVLLKELNDLVDADTKAFEAIMDAIRLPKNSATDKALRKKAIDDATIGAIHTPLRVMEKSLEAMDLVSEMAEKGNPNSVSDAGVGALCLRTAVEGAWLNVKINAQGNDHLSEIPDLLKRAKEVAVLARKKEAAIMKVVEEKIGQ